MPPILHRQRGERRTREDVSWRAKLAAVRSIPAFLRIAWSAHAGYALATILLRVLRAAVPLATFWIGKLIIDAVVAARSGAGVAGLFRLVAFEIAVVGVDGRREPVRSADGCVGLGGGVQDSNERQSRE